MATELALEGPLDHLIRHYDETLCRLLAEVPSALPGVIELVTELKARDVPIGLASSSWPSRCWPPASRRWEPRSMLALRSWWSAGGEPVSGWTRRSPRRAVSPTFRR